MLGIKGISNNELSSMYQCAQRTSQRTQKIASASVKAQMKEAEFKMHRTYQNMMRSEGIVKNEFGIEFRQSVNYIHSLAAAVSMVNVRV